MAVYTLFFIAISLLVYNSLADDAPQIQCSKLQVTTDECQKAGQEIVYSTKSDGRLYIRETYIAVSSGRCLVEVNAPPIAFGVLKTEIDTGIIELMKACPQGGSIDKRFYKITVHEVKPDDRIYGSNASPEGKAVCTNDSPVRIEDCSQAVQTMRIRKNDSMILNLAPDNSIMNTAATCTVKVSARSGMNVTIDQQWLLNVVSKSVDKNQGSSLTEACTIKNTQTAHPASMVKIGGLSGPNQRVLVQTLNNGGGHKP